MKHVIVGTAGHVDHGKTALVKALTGIDTDRLKEEKERGITIDLGFAHLSLSSGKTVGVVDVPGHERFVKNMVAGATGIDCVVMVIAADEGVMPQTREHLAICSLLGVKKGLVALTKIDLVDRDWLSLVEEDIRELTRDSFLAGAPIIPLSSITGEGIKEFLHALERIIETIEEEEDSGVFRLSIDRVFTVKGFGTVVTGSVTSGRIKVGEEVQILPTGRKGKVRGIQSHGVTVESASAGQRAAINIQGVDKSEVERGHVLCRAGTLIPSFRLDTWFQHLPSAEKEIKNRQIVRLHVGTSEIMSRLVLIGRDSLPPGEGVYAQMFLEKPATVMAGDRFVVRSYSPVTTIGGGHILDPLPRKYKKTMVAYESDLDTLRQGAPEERIKTIIRRAGWKGASTAEIIVRTGLGTSRVKPLLERMAGEKEVTLIEEDEKRAVSGDVLQSLKETTLEKIALYHRENPLKEGIPKEELRQLIGNFVPSRLFNHALGELEKLGKLVVEKERVRLPHHIVSLGSLETLRTRLEERYLKAGLTPPTKREILEEGLSPKEVEIVLEILIKEGVLAKVSEGLYFHRDNLNRLWEDYRQLLLREGKVTPLQFKEMTGLTRKFIIPLMEYFDAQKLTLRTGDYRILRGKV